MMPMVIAPEVADALTMGRPVVALESTLICHGLPRPRNLAVAEALEARIRGLGAVPATIALADGRVRIGLAPDLLARLALAEEVQKCGPRDFALVLARGALGATTVAGTIRVAATVGIRLMATGGIGGVHRGGEASLDVSADLAELARSGVAVVCSGAKVILDLPRTLEVLESLSVPLVAFGTDRFPAFYVRETDLAVPAVTDLEELAAILRVQAALGWPTSLVVANPPPVTHALPAAEVEAWCAAGLAEARKRASRGRRRRRSCCAGWPKRAAGGPSGSTRRWSWTMRTWRRGWRALWPQLDPAVALRLNLY